MLGNFLEKSLLLEIELEDLVLTIDGSCSLCNKEEETLDHLFTYCEVALNIRIIIAINCTTSINSNLCITD